MYKKCTRMHVGYITCNSMVTGLSCRSTSRFVSSCWLTIDSWDSKEMLQLPQLRNQSLPRAPVRRTRTKRRRRNSRTRMTSSSHWIPTPPSHRCHGVSVRLLPRDWYITSLCSRPETAGISCPLLARYGHVCVCTQMHVHNVRMCACWV